MNRHLTLLAAVLLAAALLAAVVPAPALECPGLAPGPAVVKQTPHSITLSNRWLRVSWQTDGRTMRLREAGSVGGTHGQAAWQVLGGELFRVRLADGRQIAPPQMTMTAPPAAARIAPRADAVRAEDRCAGWRVTAKFRSRDPEMTVAWSASLRDGSNYVTTRVVLTAGAKDLALKELIVLDVLAPPAKMQGRVQGSPIAAGKGFLACEHPLANNRVEDGRAVGGRQRGALAPGQSMELSAVIGLSPPHQFRRGFLYYLERRRAHPYRQFLHYNSWYHLNIGRPDNHMTEAECLKAIDHIGRELVVKRHVKLDAFVWDDGWDDFHSLWGFHKDFARGFQPLIARAKTYGAAQGVWMSPWGGYGGPKKKRLAHGRAKGYETNQHGFSMAGPKYRAAFRDVCLTMMRNHGVAFFKFDGMGSAGGQGGGALADDVDAVLELTRTLRREKADLFISATVGTWASPFWTLYADSIWRQGGDTGYYGAGSTRRQWITYRDKFACSHVARAGPLYPFNSLMLHGPCIGERRNPAKMDRQDQTVAEEIWTFFGSGTGLQELYISPHLLTPAMWDALARAATWARKNADVLVDSHWIGGDPGAGEVYGWASWQPRKGIVVLRNPSDKPARYDLELARALELPDEHLTDYVLTSPRPKQHPARLNASAVKAVPVAMNPFEVLVFEAAPAPGGKTYDAQAYRRLVAARAAQARAALAEARKAFLGRWQYDYKGRTYQREFLADGTANLYVLANGKRTVVWRGFTWTAQGDKLTAHNPAGGTEPHRLTDPNHLLLPLDLGTATRVKVEDGQSPSGRLSCSNRPDGIRVLWP